MQSVLIVDDIAENLYFLEVLLKGNGFDVRSAGNGADALASARKSPPDLILSDILMPVMDGFALCRECKADDRLRRIPFIFYTATYIDKKDESLALSLGADRFVIKPQQPEILMALIRDVLGDSGSAADRSSADGPHQEEELLREYNQVLFHKLEKKMADLERVNRELERQIVEQNRIEEQLRQAQKMEAIGRFSAGIAHDFNNLLTVVIGFGTLVHSSMSGDDPQRLKMEYILTAADKAANLTRNLLTFSRKQEMKQEQINLNDCIRDLDVFLRRIIGEDIRLQLSLLEGELAIVADRGHIEQVLMNLATNARDAMPAGGIFSIATDVVDIDRAFVKMHGYGIPGRYAVISVADTGIGMDETTRQRIFEPFFTTKKIGQGTGLGLSIIYGIIQQHRGQITVYSEAGHGATFRIYLPLAEGNSRLSATNACHQAMRGGDETILVVDDEAAIREYLELFLTNLGYSVLFAQDGQEAIDLVRENKHLVDLVLMDVIMPKKSGQEAALEIRKIKSDIKIVFTSGYPADLIQERKILENGVHVLMKPLTPTELAVTLRAALDGKSAT